MVMASCRHHDSGYSLRHQDQDAKQMLQGIWIDDEEGTPAFMAKGDSILFPDTTSLPMRFWIYKDILYDVDIHAKSVLFLYNYVYN